MTASPKESQIEAALTRHCRQRGLWCRKFVSPSVQGVPDRVVGGGGKVLFIELKRDKSAGGELTSLQEYEQGLMTKAGLHVVTTYGMQAAIEAVDDFFAEEISL